MCDNLFQLSLNFFLFLFYFHVSFYLFILKHLTQQAVKSVNLSRVMISRMQRDDITNRPKKNTKKQQKFN